MREDLVTVEIPGAVVKEIADEILRLYYRSEEYRNMAAVSKVRPIWNRWDLKCTLYLGILQQLAGEAGATISPILRSFGPSG